MILFGGERRRPTVVLLHGRIFGDGAMIVTCHVDGGRGGQEEAVDRRSSQVRTLAVVC